MSEATGSKEDGFPGQSPNDALPQHSPPLTFDFSHLGVPSYELQPDSGSFLFDRLPRSAGGPSGNRQQSSRSPEGTLVDDLLGFEILPSGWDFGLLNDRFMTQPLPYGSPQAASVDSSPELSPPGEGPSHLIGLYDSLPHGGGLVPIDRRLRDSFYSEPLPIEGPQPACTAGRCLNDLNTYIEGGYPYLKLFFEQSVRDYALRAETMINRLIGKGCEVSIARELSMLVLYDLAVLIDDGDSMKYSQGDATVATLHTVLKEMAELCGLANDGGILSIRFTNHETGKRNVTRRKVGNVLKNHGFGGAANIATMLDGRILERFIYNCPIPRHKPLIAMIITNGEIAEQEDVELMTVIKRCNEMCKASSLSKIKKAVRFHILHFWSRESTKRFLDPPLSRTRSLKNVSYTPMYTGLESQPDPIITWGTQYKLFSNVLGPMSLSGDRKSSMSLSAGAPTPDPYSDFSGWATGDEDIGSGTPSPILVSGLSPTGAQDLSDEDSPLAGKNRLADSSDYQKGRAKRKAPHIAETSQKAQAPKIVFRVRGLLNTTTLTHIQEALAPISSATMRIDMDKSSVVCDCYNSTKKVALIQFIPRPPSVLQKLGINETYTLRLTSGEEITLDKDFYGCTQLYDTTEEIAADIIAVCGLNGHPYGSWAARANHCGNKSMWLRHFLQSDFPQCRAIIYGYNSSLKHQSRHSIRDYIDTFLEELKKVRDQSSRRRPLILIGHSFGGIIIAHSIAEARPILNEMLRGVVFFGTPHRGLVVDDLLEMVGHRSSRTAMIRELRPESPSLQNTLERFIAVCGEKRWKIVSFRERKLTRKLAKDHYGVWARIGEYYTAVESESLILNLPDSIEETLPAEGDHSTMVKFEHRDHATYTSVVLKLQAFISENQDSSTGENHDLTSAMVGV